MRYIQSREESGEILRLLLQKIAAHPAAFTPLALTVWYEFTAGINPALNQAMNNFLNKGKKIDDAAIEKLYLEFISETKLDAQRTLQKDFQKLLNDFSGFAAETDKQVDHFGSNLQTYSTTLKQNLDTPSLAALIGNMTGDISKMHKSMQSMQTELETSRQQVGKLHQELESARVEALIDPLTGILNRRGFEIKVQDILSNQELTDKGFCLLLADIDFFKKINDTYGHLFGDNVIRAIAEALKSNIKGQDSVARWGGEEFVVLLPETERSGAQAVAEQIRRRIERGNIRRLGVQEQIGGITISIGVAAYTGDASITNLMSQADEALYISKKTGRNRTTVYGQA